MRIVSGKYRGRNLVAPDGEETRPTADRARQMLFNMLDSRLLKSGKRWSDMTVLDAFAGTGALGIEAVSRGATAVTFMENAPAALAALRVNVKPPEQDGVPVRVLGDVFAAPAVSVPCGLVFMDPPYRRELVCPALNVLVRQGWIGSNTLCCVETEKNETPAFPEELTVVDERHCGKARIWFLVLKK